jgi:hypothetical protein
MYYTLQSNGASTVELTPRAEPELWDELVRAQQEYANSLASLDMMLLDGTTSMPLPLDRRLVEEAAKVRQVAYARYRQAMDNLSSFVRK